MCVWVLLAASPLFALISDISHAAIVIDLYTSRGLNYAHYFLQPPPGLHRVS